MTEDLKTKLAGRRVVASISGGKDSAATSLLLTELGIDHDRVFMNTGWEHPKTYDYLRGELTRVIGPITEIRGERLMVDLVRHKGMFPQRTRRFCTQELKVFPMQRHISALVEAGADVVNAVGIRRQESLARSKAEEWEWSDGFDCEIWRPILTWSEQDVIDIHRRHGLAPNPLYLMGAARVGCWPCIFARKSEIRLMADIDPERIVQIRALEQDVAAAAKTRLATKGKDQTMPDPTWFQASSRDATGKRPCTPIDEVVDWSRTAHGGRQREMFATNPADEGCMRWGLCDTGDGSK